MTEFKNHYLFKKLLEHINEEYKIITPINNKIINYNESIINDIYNKIPDDLINECQNVLICPIKITINLKSEIEDDKKPQIEFSFLSSHDIPKYMNKEIKYDGVTIDTKEKLYNSKYAYIYKDVKVI